MIDRLDWDSEFFGFEVGLCIYDNFNHFNVDDFYKKAEKFRLIYMMVNELTDFPETIKLVDQKTLFEKPISNLNVNSSSIFSFDGNYHNYDDLLELSYLSGKFSRFKLDRNFQEAQFKKLYKIWLDNSISKQFAFEVLVKLKDDQIAGFVTIKKVDKNTAQIGLLAVFEKFQGQGIATELIQQAEYFSFLKDFKFLQVPTQLQNKSAINLYLKYGFKILNSTFVYHYWSI